jgi:hypothetical protein
MQTPMQTQAPTQAPTQPPTTTPNTPLYQFTEHTFTSCGASGRNGPTFEQAKLEYNVGWAGDTNFFKMTIQGIQEWTVPLTGKYKIIAAGASGVCSSVNGGKGAILEVTTTLNRGEKIKILVGQPGQWNTWGGGGGGGTFVVRDVKTPIIVAGGGGGCDYNNSGATDPQINATINTSGQTGGLGNGTKNPGPGGVDGNGGKKGNGDGAGGGMFSNGQGNAASGGLGFVNGGIGGEGNVSWGGGGGGGGFGGGGGINGNGPGYSGGGGAGGGYSGGGGGGSWGGGGGGGSYSIETTFDNPIAYHIGSGYVIIKAIK